jgi:hypothetical protein
MESFCMRKERKQGYSKERPAIIWEQESKHFSEIERLSTIIRMSN